MMDGASMFLTAAEVAELTGARRRSAQVEELARRGYPIELNRAGRPLVLRSVVEARLGMTTKKRTGRAPNFGAINGQASET